MLTARQVTNERGDWVGSGFYGGKAISPTDLFGEKIERIIKTEPIRVDQMPVGEIANSDIKSMYIIGYYFLDRGVDPNEVVNVYHYNHLIKYVSEDYEVYQANKLYKTMRRKKVSV
jgi:hypothetical protein